MTLGEMATAVDWKVRRTGLSGLDDQIRQALRDAVKHWAEEPLRPGPRPGEPHDWSFLKVSETWTTVATVADHDLPSDFLRPTRLRLLDANASPHHLPQRTYEYLLDKWAATSARFPEEWGLDLAASHLVLFPTPNAAYSALLRYVKKLPALTSDGASNVFSENYHEALIEEATGRVLADLRQYDEATFWQGQAMAKLVRAIAADRGAQTEDELQFFVTANVHGTSEDPRPLMDGAASVRRITPDY